MIKEVAIRIPNPNFIEGSLRTPKTITLSLPAPNRHHHIISKYYQDNGNAVGYEHFPDNNEQGFLDENGKFYNRRQALYHATINNQIKDKNNIRCGMLFSEDVW